MEVIYLQILFFNVLINLSEATDFPSFYIEYIFIEAFLTMISLFIVRFIAFIYPYFAYRKALVIVISFLTFKGTTHAYLL